MVFSQHGFELQYFIAKSTQEVYAKLSERLSKT